MKYHKLMQNKKKMWGQLKIKVSRHGAHDYKHTKEVKLSKPSQMDVDERAQDQAVV